MEGQLYVCMYDRHGAEQYAGDLECVIYGYHLDRAILKNAEAAYCLMPSLMYNDRAATIFIACSMIPWRVH